MATDRSNSPIVRAVIYTSAAMLAFAGNSLICRLALRDGAIDPASFTSVRLAAGAISLLAIFLLSRRGESLRGHGSWLSALSLFVYATCFSYAYITLSAGTGALILFGCVQGTMIVIGFWSGDRPGLPEWLGWLVAFAGLVWLVLPGIEAPPMAGAALMAISGISWGLYSVRGRSETNALASTTSNFTLSIVFVAALTVIAAGGISITPGGLLLAVISGALTSGVGYIIWYAALNYLTTLQAALVQLSVPAIATAGGVLFLAEPLSMRILIASALVLGGISLALGQKSRKSTRA